MSEAPCCSHVVALQGLKVGPAGCPTCGTGAGCGPTLGDTIPFSAFAIHEGLLCSDCRFYWGAGYPRYNGRGERQAGRTDRGPRTAASLPKALDLRDLTAACKGTKDDLANGRRLGGDDPHRQRQSGRAGHAVAEVCPESVPTPARKARPKARVVWSPNAPSVSATRAVRKGPRSNRPGQDVRVTSAKAEGC